jgi:AcrR family transcriptional regulator
MARRTGLSRDEIQAQALAVGSDLIGKYGLSKFSMRQVAKEIGYTVGTLYNVFKNQDDFLLKINAITLKSLQSFIQSRLTSNLVGKEILLNIAISYYVFAKEHYALWRTLFEYTLDEETTLPQWYTDKIAALMGVAEQSLYGMNLSSTQIQCTSRALWASVHGICALALADKLSLTKSEPAEDLIYELIDKYFAGLELNVK